jgi:hypothetical protein
LTTVSNIGRDSSSIRVDCCRVGHAELPSTRAHAAVLYLSKAVVCITSQKLSSLQSMCLSLALLTFTSCGNGASR